MDWTRHNMERKDIIFNGKILANARIFLSQRLRTPLRSSPGHQVNVHNFIIEIASLRCAESPLYCMVDSTIDVINVIKRSYINN